MQELQSQLLNPHLLEIPTRLLLLNLFQGDKLVGDQLPQAAPWWPLLAKMVKGVEAVDRKLAEEERAKHMSDPEVVSWLREGARAAVYWCHRSPLCKEERQARLEGKKYVEPEPDLKQFYCY